MTAKTKKNGTKTNGTKKSETARLWVEYLGFDDDIDAQVVELIGMKPVASGFYAETGLRELEFEGPEAKITQAEALLASVVASNEQLPRLIVSTEE